MTKTQETIAISIAVTAVMGVMFVMFGIWSANRFTKKYVEQSIKNYDSSIVSPHIKEYKDAIDSLTKKADCNIAIDREILKTLQEWKKQ